MTSSSASQPGRTRRARRGVIAIGVFVATILAGGLASRALAQKTRPTPTAPPFQRREEKPDAARRRSEWFIKPRAFPLGFIPAGARLKALHELDRMLEHEGKLVLQPAPAGAAAAAPLVPLATTSTTTAWTPIGPQPTSGGFFGNTSGRVTALAVDPTDPSTVYLGGAFGGVWKTTDGGNTWTPLTDNQPTLAVGSIAIDPSSCSPAPCKIIYVGTGEENFGSDSYYGAGILQSTDAGATWTQLPGTITNVPGIPSFVGPFSSVFSPGGGARIGALAVQPNNGSVLLAAVQIFVRLNGGASSGIYRSTDGGNTWTQVLPGGAGTGVFFDPNNPAIAYAALGTVSGDSDNGVYKSTNGGVTWNRINGTGSNVLPTTNVGRIEIAIAPSSTSTLYASIQNSGSAAFGSLLGMFKTTDGGTNWTRLSGTPDFCDPQCWYDMVVKVKPDNPNVIFAGGAAEGQLGTQTLFRSSDGGASWVDVSSGTGAVQLHVDHHALGFSKPGIGTLKLYAGNDGGVWSTTDITAAPGSITWTNLNGTLNITQFYPGHSIHPSTDQIGYGGTQDNGSQNFSGSLVWLDNDICGDGGWTIIDPLIPSTVYISCEDIALRKSLQNATPNTFFGADFGITPTDNVSFIPPFVGDPSNSQRIYFGTFRLWQSNDGTNTWTAISGDLTGGGGSATNGPALSTIAVAPTNPAVVYTGADDGTVQASFNVAPGSATFSPATSGLPTRSVTQFAIDPSDATGRTAYATFSGFSGIFPILPSGTGGDKMGHVFKTINGGVSWLDISGPCAAAPTCDNPNPAAGDLPNSPINDLVVDPDDPLHQTLYVATDVGVFQTSNGGVSWSTLVAGLPRVAVLSLKLRDASRTLRAATHGRGVWDLKLVPLAASPTFNLSTIAPATVTTGGATFALTANGNGFTTNSKVTWTTGSTTTILPTTPVNANQLTATVDSTLIARGVAAQVAVTDPGQPNPTNALVLTVVSPKPVFTSMSPTSATAGSNPNGITLTVNGSNFVGNSVVRWNFSSGTSADAPTTFVSATTLTAAIPATDLANAGVFPVTVFTPTPGGGETDPTLPAAQFTVNPTSPTPPPNDNFANATNVPPGNPTTTFSDSSVNSFNATTESTDPSPPNSCFPFGTTGLVNGGRAKSVWWKLTANGNGNVEADTNGSLYDTILSVWTGSPGAFASVACNDDVQVGVVRTSRVTFSATQGTSYFFMVTDFEGNGGKAVFNLNAALTPAADFTLSANPSSQTVSPGQSATYTITVTPVNGFNSAVTLSCTNPPAVVTCSSFNPPTITPGVTPNNSATLTLTAASNAILTPPAPRPILPQWILWLTMLMLLAAARFARPNRRWRWAAQLPLLLLFALLLLKLAGCGGGGGGGTPPQPRTYNVTVTGASGGTQHTTTITLVVR